MTKQEQYLELRLQARKTRKEVNCLQDILLELMDERKVTLSQIQQATGIPYPTLTDWVMGYVKSQKLDGNILALSRFFNVSINYLAYGIGDSSPFVEI